MAVLTVALLTLAGAGDGGTVPAQGDRRAREEADGARAKPTLYRHV